MQSQLTVRLSEDLDKSISNLARKLRLKRSDIVRMALERFLGEAQDEEEGGPYEKVRDLVGNVASGISDLGGAHREHLLRRIRKHA